MNHISECFHTIFIRGLVPGALAHNAITTRNDDFDCRVRDIKRQIPLDRSKYL